MESAPKKHLYPLLDINAPLYQGTAPYAFGWLPSAEGHEVYWECCGTQKASRCWCSAARHSGAEEMHRILAAATAYFAKPV